MRISIIDGFRGYFLFFMMVVHLNFFLNARLPKINHHNLLGFVEDAQGFVFLSGVVIAIVFGKFAVRGDRAGLRRAVMARVRTIFAHHAALIVLITGLALIVKAQGRDVGVLDAFGEWPALYGGLALLLTTGPPFIDILPMYIVFMLLTPAALRAMARGRHLDVVGLSIIVWLVAQTGSVEAILSWMDRQFGFDAIGIELGLHFNRLGWQIIYFGGLISGMVFVQGKLDLDRLRDAAWTRLCLLATLLLAFFSLLNLLLSAHLLPEALASHVEMQVNRRNFSVLRLADFVAALYVVVWLVVAGPQAAWPVVRKISGVMLAVFQWRPLVFLGQHSLHVYSFHVIALYLLIVFVDFRAMPRVAREAIPFLGGLSLFLPALWHARSVARSRQRRQIADAGQGAPRRQKLS